MRTVILKSGGWLAEAAPHLGANLTWLSYNGKPVYLPANSPKSLQNNPFVHGSPILLPANRTPKQNITNRPRTVQLYLAGPVHLNGHLILFYLNQPKAYRKRVIHPVHGF